MESPILEKLAQAAADKLIFLEYFVVPLRFPSLATAITNEQSAQIPKDSDFLLREINRAVVVGGVPIELPDALMDLVDSGSGRLFNTSVRPHILTVTGTGERPYILPEPRIIAGGNALSATIENVGAATIDRAHITLVGTKIFYRGSFSLAELVPER
jgi:hypothetical protein